MGRFCLSHAIAGYWLPLVPCFVGCLRGLLLVGDKGEHLIWENSEGNIWTCRISFRMFVLSIAINH